MTEKLKTKWVIVVEMAWVNPESPEGIFSKLPHGMLQWIFEQTRDIYSIHGKNSWTYRSRGLTEEKDLQSMAVGDGFSTEQEAKRAIKLVNGTKHADLRYPMFARALPVTWLSSVE